MRAIVSDQNYILFLVDKEVVDLLNNTLEGELFDYLGSRDGKMISYSPSGIDVTLGVSSEVLCNSLDSCKMNYGNKISFSISGDFYHILDKMGIIKCVYNDNGNELMVINYENNMIREKFPVLHNSFKGLVLS